MAPEGRAPALPRPLEHVGLVLASYVLLLVAENVGVGLGYRALFVGTWEMGDARLYVSPIALAVGLVPAVTAAALAELALRNKFNVIQYLAGAAGALAAFGTSQGRHFASVPVRVAWVVAIAGGAALAARVVAPRVARASWRVVAPSGVAVAALAWTADAFVLRRLYPAFHLALLGVTLLAWAGVGAALAQLAVRRHVALGGLALTLACIAWSPHAAHKIEAADNMRLVLLEHAPVLGRAVAVAAKLAPPAPLEAAPTLTPTHETKRSQDWTGRDVVVVTIDALRADHVSSYGYARRTTPNIDAIAARGARFERAYCATPHTSYSVTSLMTGKYMRPLLAMNMGEDSQMWADYMRRYGYRTGALYPPAIFFIDRHRFDVFNTRRFDFEYVKEEFTGPALRRAQLEEFVSSVPRDKPLFLWVHLFEPHEPYEAHPEHPFEGGGAVDAYDSEIAAADAFVGEIVASVSRRGEPVLIVAADHGEEFLDHGGRYHGTSVYEEQVRVPLVIAGPGVRAQTVSQVAQTIDILPTVLSALGVPRPPRIRGRDLGAVLAGTSPAGDEGLAFAETERHTMLARGTDRLVCDRTIGSCALYDLTRDPGQTKPDVTRPARTTELKRLLAGVERDHGRIEASGLPEALRRGLAGGRDAAEDVAALLDDARVDIRRAAARLSLRLRAPAIAPQLRRAAARDEDPEVRAWCTLALVRLSERPTADAEPYLDAEPEAAPGVRLAAATVLAERGDARGAPVLVARWEEAFVVGAPHPGELDEALVMLTAFGHAQIASAVPALTRGLGDVRLRPHIADTLADIGDPSARGPLLAALSGERHADARAPLARALIRLGAREEVFAPLARFAGTPDAMLESIALLHDMGALRGGLSAKGREGTEELAGTLVATPRPRGHTARGARLLVLTADGPVTARVDGAPVQPATSSTVGALAAAAPGREGDAGDVPRRVHVIELDERTSAEVRVTSPVGVHAMWLVQRADDIPPPPPEVWDGGAPREPLDAGDKAD